MLRIQQYTRCWYPSSRSLLVSGQYGWSSIRKFSSEEEKDPEEILMQKLDELEAEKKPVREPHKFLRWKGLGEVDYHIGPSASGSDLGDPMDLYGHAVRPENLKRLQVSEEEEDAAAEVAYFTDQRERLVLSSLVTPRTDYTEQHGHFEDPDRPLSTFIEMMSADILAEDEMLTSLDVERFCNTLPVSFQVPDVEQDTLAQSEFHFKIAAAVEEEMLAEHNTLPNDEVFSLSRTIADSIRHIRKTDPELSRQLAEEYEEVMSGNDTDDEPIDFEEMNTKAMQEMRKEQEAEENDESFMGLENVAEMDEIIKIMEQRPDLRAYARRQIQLYENLRHLPDPYRKRPDTNRTYYSIDMDNEFTDISQSAVLQEDLVKKLNYFIDNSMESLVECATVHDRKVNPATKKLLEAFGLDKPQPKRDITKMTKEQREHLQIPLSSEIEDSQEAVILGDYGITNDAEAMRRKYPDFHWYDADIDNPLSEFMDMDEVQHPLGPTPTEYTIRRAALKYIGESEMAARKFKAAIHDYRLERLRLARTAAENLGEEWTLEKEVEFIEHDKEMDQQYKEEVLLKFYQQMHESNTVDEAFEGFIRQMEEDETKLQGFEEMMDRVKSGVLKIEEVYPKDDVSATTMYEVNSMPEYDPYVEILIREPRIYDTRVSGVNFDYHDPNITYYFGDTHQGLYEHPEALADRDANSPVDEFGIDKEKLAEYEYPTESAIVVDPEDEEYQKERRTALIEMNIANMLDGQEKKRATVESDLIPKDYKEDLPPGGDTDYIMRRPERLMDDIVELREYNWLMKDLGIKPWVDQDQEHEVKKAKWLRNAAEKVYSNHLALKVGTPFIHPEFPKDFDAAASVKEIEDASDATVPWQHEGLHELRHKIMDMAKTPDFQEMLQADYQEVVDQEAALSEYSLAMGGRADPPMKLWTPEKQAKEVLVKETNILNKLRHPSFDSFVEDVLEEQEVYENKEDPMSSDDSDDDVSVVDSIDQAAGIDMHQNDFTQLKTFQQIRGLGNRIDEVMGDAITDQSRYTQHLVPENAFHAEILERGRRILEKIGVQNAAAAENPASESGLAWVEAVGMFDKYVVENLRANRVGRVLSDAATRDSRPSYLMPGKVSDDTNMDGLDMWPELFKEFQMDPKRFLEEAKTETSSKYSPTLIQNSFERLVESVFGQPKKNLAEFPATRGVAVEPGSDMRYPVHYSGHFETKESGQEQYIIDYLRSRKNKEIEQVLTPKFVDHVPYENDLVDFAEYLLLRTISSLAEDENFMKNHLAHIYSTKNILDVDGRATFRIPDEETPPLSTSEALRFLSENETLKPDKCLFCTGAPLDPMNVPALLRVMDGLGKIKSRFRTGVCAKHQRKLKGVVSRSVSMGNLSYKEFMFQAHNPFVPKKRPRMVPDVVAVLNPQDYQKAREHILARAYAYNPEVNFEEEGDKAALEDGGEKLAKEEMTL